MQVLNDKQEVASKIAARAFAQSYLESLIPSVYENLASNGYFYDKVERELEQNTLPWLTSEVCKIVDLEALSRHIAEGA